MYPSDIRKKLATGNPEYNLYFATNLVGLMLVVQVLLGVFTLLYGAQIILASMHQISSIFLVSSTVYFLYLNTN